MRGRRKEGPPGAHPLLLGKLRRSKEAEAPVIAIANLVAEPEVGRTETVETREAPVQSALPARERGGEGEEKYLPVV